MALAIFDLDETLIHGDCATLWSEQMGRLGWVDPKSSGSPWSSEVIGQLTFRGNPTRSYYGLGPVPHAPEILWRYPDSGGMCGAGFIFNARPVNPLMEKFYDGPAVESIQVSRPPVGQKLA